MTHERAARNCALPDFDVRTWQSTKLYQIHMGEPPDYAGQLAGRSDWSQPYEDFEHEGCGGAWYRTAWVQSLLRYRRRPMEGGGRVSNPLLDRCDDEWLLEVIAEMERWEDAWQADHDEAVLAQIKDRQGGANGR